MSLPVDLLITVVETADNWRAVVRVAGTCREVRERALKHHWKCPFVCADAATAVNVLSLHKFDDIDLSGARDTAKFAEVGRIVAKNFAESGGHVHLRTNSAFLMEGIADVVGESDNVPRFDQLEFDIICNFADEPLASARLVEVSTPNFAEYFSGQKVCGLCSNVRRQDMFHGWRIVTFRYAGPMDISEDYEVIGEIVRNATYSAIGADVIRFVNVRPVAVGPTKEIHVCDTQRSNIEVYCERLKICNSDVAISENMLYHKVKEIYIDDKSTMILYDKFENVFPKARIVEGEDRVRYANDESADPYTENSPDESGIGEKDDYYLSKYSLSGDRELYRAASVIQGPNFINMVDEEAELEKEVRIVIPYDITEKYPEYFSSEDESEYTEEF